MNLHDYMTDKLTNLSGWGTTAGAFGLNYKAWIMELEVNQVLTICISIFSLAFLIMKMYDQYLITRERKRNLK